MFSGKTLLCFTTIRGIRPSITGITSKREEDRSGEDHFSKNTYMICPGYWYYTQPTRPDVWRCKKRPHARLHDTTITCAALPHTLLYSFSRSRASYIRVMNGCVYTSMSRRACTVCGRVSAYSCSKGVCAFVGVDVLYIICTAVCR